MKNTTILLLFSVFTFLSFTTYNHIPEGIVTAFKSGNASAVSVYFGQSVELTMFDKEQIYSKTQAQVILKNFFSENPPSSFEIIHEGGKETSKYAIGTLKTTHGNSFRITLLLKNTDENTYIHQLRIEKDNAE